jgi:hypothetical protein
LGSNQNLQGHWFPANMNVRRFIAIESVLALFPELVGNNASGANTVNSRR